MAVTVTLAPAQGQKLSSSRTLASVAVFQVDLQRGAGRKISLPVPLPFSAKMVAGRSRSVQLSVSTIFTAVLGFMRFLAQKPIQVLFSTKTEPAVLLGAEEQTGKLLYAEEENGKIELLSADGEIPELVSAGENKSDLKGVS